MKIVNLGGLTLSGNMTLTVVSGVSLQFTLTCITEGTETVLNDPVTAQYTHTLTVTERLGRLYTCTVANNRPSSDSGQYYVQGMWVMISDNSLTLYVVTKSSFFLSCF